MKTLVVGDAWSQDAQDLEQEVTVALQPLMAKYRSLGYSVREICHIMIESSMVVTMDANIKP